MGRHDQQGGGNERISLSPDVASAPAVGPGKQTAAERAAGAADGEPAAPERSRRGEVTNRGGPWEPDDSFLRAAGIQEPSGMVAMGPTRARPGAASAAAPRTPPPVAATKIAAANSRKLAASIDALRALDDAALVQRRAEAQAQVAQPRLPDNERERVTREHDAVELVCAERGLSMRAEARETELLEREGPMAVRLPVTRPEMRAFIERQISASGSYREGRRQVTMMLNSELTRASFATRQLGHEQLAILDGEVAQFRKAFSLQSLHTARSMLDDGSRAIAAALATYGLPVDTVRLTAAAEKTRSGDDDGASADWLTLAHADENDARYQATEPQRQALAAWVERLQYQQAVISGLAHEQDRLLAMRAAKEHPAHHQGPRGPLLELRGVEGMDEVRRAAARSQAQVAKLPPQLVITPTPLPDQGGAPDQRLAVIGPALRDARTELARLWIEAERRHPILAAYRSGGAPDPGAAKGLSGAGNGAGDGQMRAALQQVMPKLANILRAKSALASGELSPLTLPPVVELARTQMLVPPGSARTGAVRDLVEEASSGGWKQWAIAAITLATTVLALVPAAGAPVILATNLSALALDVYGAVESYEEYGLQKALANTDLDRARSLSAEEPALTGLAVKLVSLGLNAAVVTRLFQEAVAVRRLSSAGRASDDAVRALDKLGEQHGLPRLGEEVAADARAAGGAGRVGSSSAPAVTVQGLAQSPRLKWRPNPDGAVRTPEEVVELARKWGVEIEEDVAFIARDPKTLPKNTLAEYFGSRFDPGSRLAWKNFLNAREEVSVRISREILSSDEACVAVIAHEMHEINGLRRLFEGRETVPAEEIYRLINPGIKGNLHDEAWDIADGIVMRMRAAGQKMEAP
jgi:hypothetical protein